MTGLPLVFLDTETTSLRHDRRPWEIAAIRRDPDGGPEKRLHMFVEIRLNAADLAALEIGGYFNRHPNAWQGDVHFSHADGWRLASTRTAAQLVAKFTHGAHLVGANPAFDAETLAQLLRDEGHLPSWHHRLIDVQTYASGRFGAPYPHSLRDTAELLGIEVDDSRMHTAMYDAWLAKRIYDAVNGWDLVDAEIVEETA